MSSHALWMLSACELRTLYQRRALSPVEVLDTLLDRIDRVNPVLHSYLAVNADQARAAAIEAERVWRTDGEEAPLLCGVPVSLKDTLEMAGLPTTYGSLAFRDNYQPDGEIAARLRRAGAVLLGKTNTPEFALRVSVENRLGPDGANPWNLGHTCGGSSGGGAAAVAAGLGPLAVGTDSAGSIRLPAAYTGTFGFKPTFQRIPAVQKWRASPNRSHNGPLSRTVADGALLTRALAGPHPGDPSSYVLPPAAFRDLPAQDPRGRKVAVSANLGLASGLDSEAAAAVHEAADLLRTLGSSVNEDGPPMPAIPSELEPGVWAYSGEHVAAAESLKPNFWESSAELLTDYARPVYDAGRRALAWKYAAVLRANVEYAERMHDWFKDYDFLVTAAAGPAPTLEAARANPRGAAELMVPFNLGRNPAAAVPWGLHSSGLPLAVQVISRRGDDVGLLSLCAAIERARPWAQRWPALATSEHTAPSAGADDASATRVVPGRARQR